MEKDEASLILSRLKANLLSPKVRLSAKDAFPTLIRTVLSQHTNDKNTDRAFESLSKAFPITPEALANAKEEDIGKAVKVAGLYRNKSRLIRKLAVQLLEQFKGDLSSVLKSPLEEAREKLLGLPGVGPKTADILLLFCGGKPTIPVDTHVFRVSKRLGLASKDADYEAVRRSLQALFPEKEYLPIHFLLISLGRSICIARKPRCRTCFLNDVCPSSTYKPETVERNDD